MPGELGMRVEPIPARYHNWSNTVNFSYTCDRNNMQGELRAETVEGIDVPGHAGYFVSVLTSKSSRGGVAARGHVYKREGGFITTDLFGDWHETLASSAGRATEKVIRATHERALELLPAALVRARAHTLKKLGIADDTAKPATVDQPTLVVAPPMYATSTMEGAAGEAALARSAANAMDDFNHPSNPMHY